MKTLRLIVSYVAAAALATLACGAIAVAGGSAKFNHEKTQAFVDQAAYASRAEVQEAKYVMDHTKSQPVKDFAEKMIHDHTMALDQLEQVASAGGFKVPEGVDKKDQSAMDKLENDQGAKLDTAYSSDQERDHKQVISKFEQAAKDSSIAPAVRDYANSSLPILKEHLRMAQRLATASKGNRSAG